MFYKGIVTLIQMQKSDVILKNSNLTSQDILIFVLPGSCWNVDAENLWTPEMVW